MSVYNGVWTGLVSVTGNVFCHWPTLAYWIGNGSGAAWKMQSTATVLLAFNRCIEAFDEKLANIIFKGKRTFFWMFLPIAWGVFDFLVGPPGFFNPIYSVIMYNPHAGYFNDYTKTTKVFGQIFLIAAFLFIVSTGHLIIQNLTTVPFGVSQLLQYLYLLFNGLPAVIYLMFNVTLKRKVRRMFFGAPPAKVITIVSVNTLSAREMCH
uniref:Uncharacterized protein n=1 Tax=Panagrolaimus sp. PS1159 TaxID=55785 RepID=A0AC35GXL4_9BILA